MGGWGKPFCLRGEKSEKLSISGESRCFRDIVKVGQRSGKEKNGLPEIEGIETASTAVVREGRGHSFVQCY